jgi:hypothetical protein
MSQLCEPVSWGNVSEEMPEVARYQERINKTSHAAECGDMFS